MTLKSKTESPSSQDASRTHETEAVLEKVPNKRVSVNLPHFEPLLDSAEAAALLKIHPKTLQKMARNREICGIQIGKLWRFRPSTLNEWLSQKLAS
jgi:excisionase family DNA binding protein